MTFGKELNLAVQDEAEAKRPKVADFFAKAAALMAPVKAAPHAQEAIRRSEVISRDPMQSHDVSYSAETSRNPEGLWLARQTLQAGYNSRQW